MMTEVIKTTAYAAVALLVFGLAYYVRPANDTFNVRTTAVGTPLFPLFTDTGEAARLRIVKFDPDLGERDEIEVAKDDVGQWILPSHNDYPADAEQQSREASLAMLDLEILNVASELPDEHAMFGVLDPTQDTVSEGIGSLVAVYDETGEELAGLIIGEPVQNAPGQRFVRCIGKDEVYATKINPDAFSTRFEDWINTDLLQLNPLDVSVFEIEDYAAYLHQIGRTRAIKVDQKSSLTMRQEETRWEAGSMVKYENGAAQPIVLTDYEELNQQSLNRLKAMLSQLKIVDVKKKPEGFDELLKLGPAVLRNEKLLAELDRIGIFPFKGEIRSANGELKVGLGTGVEYVLKFGQTATLQEGTDEDKLNRYLFLNARLNENLIPTPDYEEMPPLPTVKKNEAGEDTKSAIDLEEQRVKIEKERSRIEKENKKKLDLYNDVVAAAEKEVESVNARVGQWYYVISEDVYKRVRPGFGDLVSENEEAKREGFGIDAFRSLERGGLDPNKRESPSGQGSG